MDAMCSGFAKKKGVGWVFSGVVILKKDSGFLKQLHNTQYNFYVFKSPIFREDTGFFKKFA